MDRINHPTATAERTFTGGNPAADIPATVVTPEYMTMLQEEVCNVILAAGITLNPAVYTQLRDAIQGLVASAGIPTAAGAGTADAITAAFSPAITLSDRRIVVVTATGANTITGVTFAPNGLAAKTVLKANRQALAVGDIPGAGAALLMMYDATYNANTGAWLLLNVGTSLPSNLARLDVVQAYTRQQSNAAVVRTAQSGSQAVDMDLHQLLSISATGAITMAAPSNLAVGKSCHLLLYAASALSITWNAAYVSSDSADLPTAFRAGKWGLAAFFCHKAGSLLLTGLTWEG